MRRQENKNYAILGLCMRAGKLITGAQGTEKAVKSGEGVLALFDASASDGTKKAIRDACTYMRVECLQLPSGVLSRETGKAGRMAAAVDGRILLPAASAAPWGKRPSNTIEGCI